MGTVKRFFAKFLEKAKEIPWVIFVFFIFLTISLFLGDGKQPFVDVFMALGILLSFGALFYQKIRIRPLPGKVNFLWLILIIYYVISIFFSDSAAYSISATIRLVEAYLAYEIFYSIASEKTLKLFIGFTVFLVWVAQAFALLFLIFPAWARFLPLMNLLYANYGHNHLADLLLIAMPLVFFRWLNKPNWFNLILLAFFVVGTVLTFARGAWLILLLFFGFQFLVIKTNKFTPGVLKILALTIIIFFAIVVGLSFLTFNQKAQQKNPVGTLTRQLVKPLPWQDPRIRYWKQAVAAIGERPWFGSGPGTFYLQSKRLQEAPDSYSWFAHSFFLQSLVDLGFVGFMILFLFLFYHSKTLLIGFENSVFKNQLYGALLWGLGLTFVYSFFEYNLDYLVVWLFFWISLGIVNGLTEKNNTTCLHENFGIKALKYVGVSLLVIFYFSWLIGLTANAISNKDKMVIFYFSPYQKDTILAFLQNQNNKTIMSPRFVTRVVEWFYRSDPEVLSAFAAIYPTDSLSFYKRMFALDPHSPAINNFRKLYLMRLIDAGDTVEVGKELEKISGNILTGVARKQLSLIDFLSPELHTFYTKETIITLFEDHNKKEALSKFFYLLGLDVLKINPSETKIFWTIAKDTSPQWSYFHLELAALLHVVFHQDTETKEVVGECLNNIYARRHCQQYNTLTALLRPGLFQKEILAIPRKSAP